MNNELFRSFTPLSFRDGWGVRQLFAWLIFVFSLSLCGCHNNGNNSDAYGNFEANDIIISAEASGKLLRFEVEEGEKLSAGKVVGLIDTTQFYLKKQQLLSSMNAVQLKTINIQNQIKVLEERKANAEREKKRVENLLKDGAATQKQLDDISGELDVINRQIESTRTQLQSGNSAILAEIKPLEVQLQQLSDQIDKSIITNPINGTVLKKFAEPNEVVVYGKPLYKIADMDTIFLRVYISGDQLPNVKIGQPVAVYVDKTEDELRQLDGQLTWISETAEFTPKIIQTKEERVNLVYAAKVKVKNDGTLKIGMPGEVKF